MSIRIGAALPVLLLLCSAAAHAQQRPATSFPDSTKVQTVIDPPQEEIKPEVEMSTSGYFLGAIGMLAGSAVGSSIGQSRCPDESVDKDCMSRHAFAGALFAGAVLIPVGVHIASPHRKNLPLSIGVSAVSSSLLYLGARAMPGKPIGLAAFMSLPIEIMTSIRLERSRPK